MQSTPGSERAHLRRIATLLTAWFGGDVNVRAHVASGRREVDLVAIVQGATLAIELKSSAEVPRLRAAIQQVKAFVRGNEIPIVAVPFMGETGKRLCAAANVSWLDLSGNADIRGPRLRVFVQGQRNHYASRGRPSTPYAPKASRVIRYLLAHPHEAFTQRAISTATRVDPSNVTRIIARLREDGIVRGDRGQTALADRELALASWRASYRFDQHDIVRAHVPSRSGIEALTSVHGLLAALKIRHAFTGLSGAWAYSQYANYRLVTVFVDRVPNAEELAKIDAVEQDAGANVWFVVPKDTGVFDGARSFNGFDVAHPVQVWIDLAAQPERAAEAADALYEQILRGEWDG